MKKLYSHCGGLAALEFVFIAPLMVLWAMSAIECLTWSYKGSVLMFEINDIIATTSVENSSDFNSSVQQRIQSFDLWDADKNAVEILLLDNQPSVCSVPCKQYRITYIYRTAIPGLASTIGETNYSVVSVSKLSN